MKHSTITVEGVQPADNFVIEYPSSAVSSGVYARFGKRIFDLMISIVAAPVLVPVIAILWFIARRDGGSGFFSHKRVGKNGKEFKCHKIRTMVPDAEAKLEIYLKENPVERKVWEAEFKLRNDPRITKVGRFLRATSLDELPQFFNVLRGEMSFVGPRPVPAVELNKYGAAKAFYLSSKPGITGLWQVSGRNDVSYDERIQMDIDYAEKKSLVTDIGIMLKTISVVVRKTGY